MARPKKTMEVNKDSVPNGQSIPIGEIGNQAGGIEPVSDNDFAVELEAFMHEPVKIIVQKTGASGELEIITPTVNQLNQPIVRGVPTVIKRKYVEALARSRNTVYRQRQNPYLKEQIEYVPDTSPSYPFTVLEDLNPNGQAWLQSVLDER